MIPVNLARIKTKDGVYLEGIYIRPKKKSETAFVLVHGLGSRFYSGQTITKEVSSVLAKLGIGYFKFNNRGHDLVNRDGLGKNKMQGQAFEKFEDCIKDIRAVIGFAKKLGYKKIILTGHSTGANKILYYQYKTKDKSVIGLALLAGLSDISAVAKKIGMKELKRRVNIVERTAGRNPKRNKLIPEKFDIFSEARYLSLLQPGRNEDTFPYHGLGGSWKAMRSIRKPMLIIFGAKDEHMDRLADKLLKTFQNNAVNSKKVSGAVIAGANHGFYKKEKELAKVIVDWAKKI